MDKQGDYCLQRTLKQHTPLIQFQGEQHGATLRATEVKPKLDAFLKKKCASDEWKDWLIDQDADSAHQAFDYRLSFLDVRPEYAQKQSGIKLITDPVHKSVHSEKTALKIVCFNDSLIKALDKYIESFFVLHNFGTRQNKGWGCFTLESTDKTKFERCLRESGLSCFKRKFIQEVFPIKDNWAEQIRFDHQRLKSGLNHPSFKDIIGDKTGYEKSKLFLHFCEKQDSWEKKALKSEISSKRHFKYPLFAKTGKGPAACEKGEKNTLFIRALLGLAEHYEYQIDDQGQPDRNRKYKVKIESADGKIDRFKSPITFKVFGDSIYLIAEDINKDIFDKKFNFHLGTRTKGVDRKEKDDNNFIKLAPLFTPQETQFDLANFLKKHLPDLDYVQL